MWRDETAAGFGAFRMLPRDADTVNAARGRWSAYLEAGHHLTYWQQNDGGGWEKKAEANQPNDPPAA